MKFAFYFATRNVNFEETLAYTSLTKIKNLTKNNFDIFYTNNNTKGLSFNYNKEMLEKYSNSYDYIVFVHDDLYIDDLAVCNKLEEAHKQFDIVGLAGGVNPRVTKPALWHLMCGGFGSGNLRGAVAHPVNEKQIAVTSFGPTPSRVAILDGLFLSIDVRKANSVRWSFNENYEFHHYDIASSIDANNKKLKLGVAPIWCIHKSPGLLNINDSKFVNSQEKFISEYSNPNI